MPAWREMQRGPVHSSTCPRACPRATPAVSRWGCRAGPLALWEWVHSHQATALPWLCCTCTGFTDCFHYCPSRRESLWQSWLGQEPGLAAGFWFRGWWDGTQLLLQDLTSLPYLPVLSTSCTNNFSESLGLRSKVLQKIEELRMTMISVSVPDEFLCPITRELMNDPVIATGKSLHDLN